jgi:hypothetical protein
MECKTCKYEFKVKEKKENSIILTKLELKFYNAIKGGHSRMNYYYDKHGRKIFFHSMSNDLFVNADYTWDLILLLSKNKEYNQLEKSIINVFKKIYGERYISTFQIQSFN